MEVKADKGEWWGDKGEWNSSMIYIDLIHCKNVCKCHNALPLSTTILKNYPPDSSGPVSMY
jgi:hypothetical protein